MQADNCSRIFRQPLVVLVVGRVAALSHLRVFGTSRGVFQPVLFGKIDLTSYKSNTVRKMNHTCFFWGGAVAELHQPARRALSASTPGNPIILFIHGTVTFD